MGSDKIWNALMELSIVCGMNQRYSQYMLGKSEWWVTFIDVCVVISTIAALVLGLIAYFDPKRSILNFANYPRVTWFTRLDVLSVMVSVIASSAGVALIVAPAGDNAYHFNQMFQAWSDLRQDVDQVMVDADSTKLLGESGEEYLERRYRELLTKKNSLNSREPAADQDLLEKFLAQEERSRGVNQDEKTDTAVKQVSIETKPRDSVASH